MKEYNKILMKEGDKMNRIKNESPNNLMNTTGKEKSEYRQRAQETRDRQIQEVIDSGVPVIYTSTSLSLQEQETVIICNPDKTVDIDTTINGDIIRCLKNGYKIVEITKGPDGRVIGVRFSTGRNKISFRR